MSSINLLIYLSVITIIFLLIILFIVKNKDKQIDTHGSKGCGEKGCSRKSKH